jgi:predicted translin family RNA/ssDNA-binding protein
MPSNLLASLKASAKETIHNRTTFFAERFESQRRDFGMGYRLQNDLILASKQGVKALKSGNMEAAKAAETEMLHLWQEIDKIDVPLDTWWEFSGNAGQELVEYLGVSALWPYVSGKAETPGTILSVTELHMRPPTWLRGLGDVPGEIGKMVLDVLLKGEISKEERIAIRRRLVEVVEDIYNFLDQYETCYPQVINDSRRKGFRNTFRGMLQNVGFLLEKMKRELLEAIER